MLVKSNLFRIYIPPVTAALFVLVENKLGVTVYKEKCILACFLALCAVA